MDRSEDKNKGIREKIRSDQERMRQEGLRPIQIWVPDVRAPGFEEEAHRQSLAVASSEHEAADQEWIDAISDRDGE